MAKPKRKNQAAPKGKAKTKRQAAAKPTRKPLKRKQHAAKGKADKAPTAKAKRKQQPKARKANPRKAANGSNRKGRRPGPVKVTNRKRKNPDAEAAAIALYEEFHGKAPDKATKHRREIEYRDQLAELGKLKRLDIITVAGSAHQLDFSGPVMVCSEPYGHQLYIIGGNQAVPLDSLDLGGSDLAKDSIFLGACPFICYDTVKGFHNFELTQYGHEFAEEGGEYPMLHYDNINRLLFFTGGSYQVRPEGIVD